MILFFNIKLTPHRFGNYHRHPWVPNFDRFDIFKYCLASYTAMTPLIERAIFYIELEDYQHRKEELESYIKELYPACELYWYRNDNPQMWKQNSRLHFKDSDVIWYAGNDDHIFIDYDLELIQEAIEILKQDPDPMAVVYYSHWPEQCRVSHKLQGTPTNSGNFIKMLWCNFDSIHILKGYRFKSYWDSPQVYAKYAYNRHLFRSDYLIDDYFYQSNFYAPTREIVRHYDGYSHLGIGITPEGMQSAYLSNIVPPLYIPDGFFDKNIKIRVGFTSRMPGWVTLNTTCDLYAATPSGVDYRWLESDIPLFWRDRISEIVRSDSYNIKEQAAWRDHVFIQSTKCPMNAFKNVYTPEDAPPEHWYTKHLKSSLT